ncbi:unnamed protein product [Cochlearia groenlandica]
MKRTKITLCFIFLCVILVSGVRGSISPSQEQPQEDSIFSFRPKTLFVFGDSYADTGNTPAPIAASWRFPYGITFPGKPTGRFTDGRVSTDFLAKYLGLPTPIAYKRIKRYARSRQVVRNGMNFAYGGAGVFNTIFKVPNSSVQIDFFEQVLSKKVYSQADLKSSVAFFSFVGNDYLTYNRLNGTQKGRPAFIRKVVNKILLDVKRIKDLGVSKVLVTLSPPQQCLPLIVTPKGCDTNDSSTSLHNGLLRKGLIKLNNEKKKKKIDDNNGGGDKSFLMLDLYNAFVTIFNNKGVPGVSTFSEPLKACCVGTKQGQACGDVDKNGEKLYSLCKDPKSFFFWDDVHLSDQGWLSVSSLLLLPNSKLF